MLALLLLWPLHRAMYRSEGDIPLTVAWTAQAGKAITEGQFPVRVGPDLFGGVGYPLFQFYANFPFTLGGLLERLPGIGPYDAWRMVVFGALLCGGSYLYRFALLFVGRGTRGRIAASTAGAAFMAAPYMLSDLFARGAFAEFIAFNLLPCVLFYTFHAFRRPGVRHVVAAGVAWTLLGLTHNITYFYSSICLALLFLSFVRMRRSYLRRLFRLTAAAGLHAALVAWYFAPQVVLLPNLNITLETRTSTYTFHLGQVPLSYMLAPHRLALPRTFGLGVQFGWPLLGGILGAVALAMISLHRGGGRRRSVGRAAMVRAMSLRLTALVALAVVLACMPPRFWLQMPEVLKFVQMPYRLLLQATAFASVLLALALWWVARPRTWHTTFILLAIGLTASFHGPFAPRGLPALAGDRSLVSHPLDHSRDYFHSPVLLTANGRLDYPGMMQGDRFVGMRWANRLSAAAWLVAGAMAVIGMLRRRRRRRPRRASRHGELPSAMLAFFAFGVGLFTPWLLEYIVDVTRGLVLLLHA